MDAWRSAAGRTSSLPPTLSLIHISGLRIFEDAGGKLNVSAEELGCEALVVSNFTLYGDTKKGRCV